MEKTLDMKFRLLTVIKRDFEAMLERAKEREYTQEVKDISKILEEICNLKIKAIEHKVAADGKQEDIDVWDQERQSKTHVYETIIETPEYQMRKLRQGSTEKQVLEDELITKAKGQQRSEKFINHQRKTT